MSRYLPARLVVPSSCLRVVAWFIEPSDLTAFPNHSYNGTLDISARGWPIIFTRALSVPRLTHLPSPREGHPDPLRLAAPRATKFPFPFLKSATVSAVGTPQSA